MLLQPVETVKIFQQKGNPKTFAIGEVIFAAGPTRATKMLLGETVII